MQWLEREHSAMLSWVGGWRGMDGLFLFCINILSSLPMLSLSGWKLTENQWANLIITETSLGGYWLISTSLCEKWKENMAGSFMSLQES